MGSVFIFTQNGMQGGYETLPVAAADMELFSFAEAEAVPADGDLDLMIIDCMADTSAGLALLQTFKQRRPDVPIIFVTDSSSEDVVLNAFKSGAREYFKKPLDNKFSAMIGKILQFKCDISSKKHRLPGAGEEKLPELPLTTEIPERLQRSVDYIKQNLKNPIKLDDMARQACLSKYHFCRMFKKHVGISPFRYLLDMRIDRAKLLLCRPSFNIASVAINAGFSDQSEFNKRFKSVTGITPSAYRKSI